MWIHQGCTCHKWYSIKNFHLDRFLDIFSKEYPTQNLQFWSIFGILNACIVKKTKWLALLADPWPVFEGYVEWKFQDEANSGKEADAYIAELKRDFAKDEE